MATATDAAERLAAPTADDLTLDAFRRWGYLQADLDWLGRLEPLPHAELDVDGDAAERARGWYCGTLGVEFMHIPDPARRAWVSERMEAEPPTVGRRAVAELLCRSTTFEETLQSRYIGNKRFAVEGSEALLPLLAEALEEAGERGVEKAILAMSHRGRLNVMAHIVGVPLDHLLAGFEDVDPRSIMGAGDVKYHLGATGTYSTRAGAEIGIHLASNPSHLEAIDAVAAGRARAKQARLGEDGAARLLPIVMHGDAAFAGQGVTAETLNLADIPGFTVGGTVHVIVNNWIGFTTEPRHYQSWRFASDLARRLPIPILHVNGEDPEAVVRAARLAVAWRQEFATDVVIDMIAYRRHGHSEIDDPTMTQPVLYAKIVERPPLWESYAERAGVDREAIEEIGERVQREMDEAKEKASRLEVIPHLRRLPDYWSSYIGGCWKPEQEVATGIDEQRLERLCASLTTWPRDFHIHTKVAKLLEQRAEMGRGERGVDFGMAEALAFGSLLEEGVPVRLSGQDSRRGTFAHRHSIWIDTESSNEYSPFPELARDGAFFEIHDSPLSEAAIVGFEYGFSRDYPEALVLWEAQFGDFVNGAQVILDQFVTAGEDKWGLLSGMVMLLPHGFEGQGPEHSSARMERFLQLCAEDNIQVAQPSTAGQYFHLLRRQVLRQWRKPLIVMTPKSLLRNQAAASPIGSFQRDHFLTVRPDMEVEAADRILLCSGKIAHELRAEREKRGADRTAVVSIEQLYPFPDDDLIAELDRFREARDIRWVQEEPANMGALFFVMPRIERITRGRHVRTVKRSASASPATGSGKAHQLEQKTLLQLAFS